MRSLYVSMFLALASALSAQELPDKPQPQPKDRIMWFIPTYDVVTKDQLTSPLSGRDKFRLFTESSFDRFTIVTASLDAAINQALDIPEGYGQGGEGYAKRYGAAVADKVTSVFFKTFAYASLFMQDARYFVMTSSSGTNSKGRRIGYAMSRVFVTRGDNGRAQFNASNILGNATAASITNIWYPPRDRDVETTLSRFGSRVGVDMASNIVKEFWQELSGVLKIPH